MGAPTLPVKSHVKKLAGDLVDANCVPVVKAPLEAVISNIIFCCIEASPKVGRQLLTAANELKLKNANPNMIAGTIF